MKVFIIIQKIKYVKYKFHTNRFFYKVDINNFLK